MDWRERLKELVGSNESEETCIWHAVFVMTGNEEIVRQKIEYAFKDTDIFPFIPKRRINERKNGIWNEKIRPLFPGYILLRGKISIKDYYTLKTVPGILRILKDNNNLYRIHPDEINVISRLMVNGELIGTSIGYKQGDSIVITEGPLYGMEGLIKSIDYRKGRVKVILSFLGDERTIDLGLKLISSAD